MFMSNCMFVTSFLTKKDVPLSCVSLLFREVALVCEYRFKCNHVRMLYLLSEVSPLQCVKLVLNVYGPYLHNKDK